MTSFSKFFSPFRQYLIALFAIFLISILSAATAGEGHGDAPAATSGVALPKFSAHSDLFEAVGTLSGGELSILIDRYGDNSPVLQAKVSLESGAVKAVATFHADIGDYSTPAAPFSQPGTYPITLTIEAGADVDILAGELVVPTVDDHADSAGTRKAWARWLAYATAVLAAAIAIALLARRRSQRTGQRA